MKGYFDYVHRDASFRDRWTAALGDVTDKVVVEIGCGPGNVFATLRVKPKALIGIDVAAGALEQARTIGYEPLLADAHDLPLSSLASRTPSFSTPRSTIASTWIACSKRLRASSLRVVC